VHFTIGRRQVSVVDAAKHTMTVYNNNQAIKTIRSPRVHLKHTTYNGKMVISEEVHQDPDER